MKFSKTALAALLMVGSLSGANAQSLAETATKFDSRSSMYEVTVTNVTRGAFFTPVLVVSHRPDVSLFALGQPASAELAILAEGGDTEPLAQVLRANSQVTGVANSEGLLEPGQSVTVQVPAQGTDRISLAAMILPTNDGFVALNGVAVPRGGSQRYCRPPSRQPRPVRRKADRGKPPWSNCTPPRVAAVVRRPTVGWRNGRRSRRWPARRCS